ncbi:hypothetical protein [Algoriphagus hitonicola]|uniref:hypothetical protein n=1 Tax=Algoriphagus hitonicola TaxID=435880 RepID=UPI00360B7ED4
MKFSLPEPHSTHSFLKSGKLFSPLAFSKISFFLCFSIFFQFSISASGGTLGYIDSWNVGSVTSTPNTVILNSEEKIDKPKINYKDNDLFFQPNIPILSNRSSYDGELNHLKKNLKNLSIFLEIYIQARIKIMRSLENIIRLLRILASIIHKWRRC